MESTQTKTKPAMERKPPWLKVRAPGGENYTRIKQILRGLELNTVCEEAHCPNVGECWSKGTATVMILGDTCTRGCRFCAVKAGNPRGLVDAEEPERVARAIAGLGLRYVVLTMVDRDDLPDGGAEHVARTVRALHGVQPGLMVETLVGDFSGRRDDIATVLAAEPEVFAHNIEVVRRLTPMVRDRRCSYDRSLMVLAEAKRQGVARYVKSSLMVGVGETDEEITETLADLRETGVDIVTLGQYLRPSAKHLAVDCYRTPEDFERWQIQGNALGFAYVASGPLVRSSYHAAEAFVAATRPGTATEEPQVVPISRLTEPR